MKPVAMHPALAEFLNSGERVLLQQGRRLDVRIESREGESPTSGVYLWEALLRPAAVSAGVIAKDDHFAIRLAQFAA